LSIPTDLEFYERDIKDASTEDFTFFAPLEKSFLEKALTTKDDDPDPFSWKVGGYASSSDTDLEGESLIPGGIDFEYFLRFGWLNDDHQKGAAHKLGIPTEAYIDGKGFYVKGYLLKGVPEARGTFLLMKELATGNHPRKVGFSVEGKVLKQEGTKIIKSWVKDVAITANPINTSTYANLVKSLSKYDVKKPEIDKGLSAGYETQNQTGGDSLRVQDLERKLKILTNKEGLSEDELREYIMMKAGYSPETTETLIKYIRLLKRLPEQEKSFYPSAPATIV
jgi:hypothetical protein